MKYCIIYFHVFKNVLGFIIKFDAVNNKNIFYNFQRSNVQDAIGKAIIFSLDLTN